MINNKNAWAQYEKYTELTSRFVLFLFVAILGILLARENLFQLATYSEIISFFAVILGLLSHILQYLIGSIWLDCHNRSIEKQSEEKYGDIFYKDKEKKEEIDYAPTETFYKIVNFFFYSKITFAFIAVISFFFFLYPLIFHSILNKGS